MANSKKIWWLLPALSGAGGVAAILLLSFWGRLPLGLAAKEGAVFSLTLVLAVLPSLWLIKAYPTKVGLSLYAVAVGLSSGIFAIPVHRLLEDILPGGNGEALPQELRVITYLLYPALLILLAVIIALKRQLEETEKRYALQQNAAALLKEAELFKLRQQLQPHFLYNSLNAISALIITAPDKAGEMISRLADFLRTAVKQGRSETVPLAEELDYLRQYLWIESVRFGDRLCVEWAGADDVAGAHIPPLLLQPVIENAIRYAVYGQTGAVTISILVESNSEILRITVRNPYDATMKSSGTGFGLEGIRRRLYLIYARQDLLKTEATDGHFTTTILIPQ